MRVKSVICSVGRSGYMHRDLLAHQIGGKARRFSLSRQAFVPRIKRIVEPATIVSVMLELDDGQIAFGDCADVILAGVAGRDPAFRGEDHVDYLRREIAPLLKGRDVAKFRDNAAEFDRLPARAASPLHTAVRYGLTQALLHATALVAQEDHGGNHRRRVRHDDIEDADPDPGLGPQGRSLATRSHHPEARGAVAACVLHDRQGARRASRARNCLPSPAPLRSASRRSATPTTSRASISMSTARSVSCSA